MLKSTEECTGSILKVSAPRAAKAAEQRKVTRMGIEVFIRLLWLRFAVRRLGDADSGYDFKNPGLSFSPASKTSPIRAARGRSWRPPRSGANRRYSSSWWKTRFAEKARRSLRRGARVRDRVRSIATGCERGRGRRFACRSAR